MKLSEHWLREWVNPNISSQALVEQLTMAGLEVESVEGAAGIFSGVKVGKVISTMPHPNATKLTLCKVDIAEAEPLDIVCGAANVREGLCVAVAIVGAKLPGDFIIKKAKLRGELSLGMLCSSSELGLSESSNGIMELPEGAPVGQCVRRFLNLDDSIIEIDLTPNRGDCLSMRGIAREVAALNDMTWKDVEIESVEPSSTKQIKVEITDSKFCPSYLCQSVTGFDNSVTVPQWMSERLRRSGLRSHSLVVDITNYVMMEIGQPMHAFDADKVIGIISVRLAKEGESLALLDQQVVKLKPSTLVIADEEKVLAIAGVMGGFESAVTSQTKNIIFESAHFLPEKIAGVARSYGLATDSAYRFERGVSPTLQKEAMQRAISLLQRFAGGIVGALTDYRCNDFIPKAKHIELSIHNVNRLLGTKLTQTMVVNYLSRLGMTINRKNDALDFIKVEVPAFRFDISIEADLIEEVARMFGYNAIPLLPIKSYFQAHKRPENKLNIEDLRQVLVDFGYSEAINYSFVCPEKQALLLNNENTVELVNPLSKELSQMRQSLMLGLLNSFRLNLSRQVLDQKLFEIGLCFERDKDSGELTQINRIAGLLSGSEGAHDWSKTKRVFDFYDLKGDVERILGASLANISFAASTHPSFHPGKSAGIYKKGVLIGQLGELHPRIIKQMSLTQTPYLFELEVDSLLEKDIPVYTKLSKYPSITRDLSLVVDEKISFYDISNVIYSVKHAVPLQQIELFDVYHGDNLEKGKKSIAIGLNLQHSSRTLVDDEVNDYMSAILLKLEEDLSIIMRE